MNLSYYILVFDLGAEVILSKFKMGEQSARTTKKSTMVVETHTTYNNEVKEGDEVNIFLSHFDHDNKRLHYKLEMYDKNKNKYIKKKNVFYRPWGRYTTVSYTHLTLPTKRIV